MKFQDAQSCFTAVGNKEAACLAAHKDHWADAALCIDGDRVPKPVRSAVSCLNKQPDNLAQFGICMVANEGDGEAQRIAACYVEAQGEPAAVAVCVAAPNLTLDQRIVLECAAETNGAVPATAACASGKMAVRELSNCQGKHFGDDDCFGESNEFRRAAKALGMEIGPHSVVGEVLNVQLRITDATSGPVLQVGTQALGDAVKIANDNGFLPDPSHPGSLLVPPGTGGIVRLGQEFWDGLTHFIPIF